MPFLQNPTDYDVVIIGAGPAGGQLARELSANGKKILLVEKLSDFSKNQFSSGATPLEVLEEFQLPQHLIELPWSSFQVFSSHQSHLWRQEKPLGVILDFKKLREFLAYQTKHYGGKVELGCSYQKHRVFEGFITVWLKEKQALQQKIVTTKILVDATGSQRALSPRLKKHDSFIEMTGIEVHLQTNPDIASSFKNKLSFYLGKKWVPHGYAWVFPMQNYGLKIGVIAYKTKQNTPLNARLDQMIAFILKNSSYTLLEKHGKTLSYCLGQKDMHALQGEVIAIGDAISTLNPMGCEGIRHALNGARIASSYIQKRLENLTFHQIGYQAELKHYFGWKWKLSELAMKKIYLENHDANIDRAVKALKKTTLKEWMASVFSYDWKALLKFYLRYLFTRQ